MIAASGPPDPPPYTLVPVLLTTVVFLHLTGTGAFAAPAQTWADAFDRSDPVRLAFTVLRFATVLTCYHLLATQLLALVGRMVGRVDLVRCADRLTPAPLRTTTRRLAGIGLTAVTTLAVPVTRAAAAPAAVPAPGSAVMRAVDLVPGTASIRMIDPAPAPPGGMTIDDRDADAASLPVGPRVGPPPEPVPPGTAAVRITSVSPERQHIVRAGDHLWAIAEAELAAQAEIPADAAAVDAYWGQLVLANPQLDDPDLVFPGDVIQLPPVRHTG